MPRKRGKETSINHLPRTAGEVGTHRVPGGGRGFERDTASSSTTRKAAPIPTFPPQAGEGAKRIAR